MWEKKGKRHNIQMPLFIPHYPKAVLALSLTFHLTSMNILFRTREIREK